MLPGTRPVITAELSTAEFTTNRDRSRRRCALKERAGCTNMPKQTTSHMNDAAS